MKDFTAEPGPLAPVSHALKASEEDYGFLLDAIGNSRFVLLGEASHGTLEFYRERARITQKLIMEKGFNAVAVEADWPDAYRVNRFVKGEGEIGPEMDPLDGFRRFPEWMWRNSEVRNFVSWLRRWNDSLVRDEAKAGFYGLDLYSLYASIEAVLAYLDRADPAAARRARDRYACLAGSADAQRYGYRAALGLGSSCEREAIGQLLELQRKASEYTGRANASDGDEYFFAEQNARMVVDAERYYRVMFQGHVASWNLRDQHMADTLEALEDNLETRSGQPAKIVVWAHNSHLGDARATEMRTGGEQNVGQLVRERHGREAFLTGFTTYAGTVRAASDWGMPGEEKPVKPALAGSYEALFHDLGVERFMLDLRASDEVINELAEPMLERAIGVVYQPETERQSHYFKSSLPYQFDALLHFDLTHAVDTLGPPSPVKEREAPETFPFSV